MSDCKHEIKYQKDGYGGYEAVCANCFDSAEDVVRELQERAVKAEARIKELAYAQVIALKQAIHKLTDCDDFSSDGVRLTDEFKRILEHYQ